MVGRQESGVNRKTVMAMKSQASKSFSQNAKPLLGLLVLFSFSSYGVCQAISISCPTTFYDGYITRVDCLVYTTTFAQLYCSFSATVEFFFSNSSMNTRLCQTPYNGPLLSEVDGDMNCGMVTSSSGERTFELNFRGRRASHVGGRLTCSLSCTQSLSTISSESCGPLDFSSVEKTDSSCNDGCKAGIIIAVIIVFAIGGYAGRRRYVRVTTMVEVIG